MILVLCMTGEHRMPVTRSSVEVKSLLSTLLWALAIMLWGASEALLLYTKAHKSVHALWSISVWTLPLMIILPSLTAIETCLRFTRTRAKPDNTSQKWSYEFAVLLFFTNIAIFTCIATLLTKNF